MFHNKVNCIWLRSRFLYWCIVWSLLLLCQSRVLWAQEAMHDLFSARSTARVLHSRVFHLHYLTARVVAAWVLKGKPSILSRHGLLKMDVVQNTIWVRDTDKVMANIDDLISSMDHPVQQVQIKARIIDIDDKYMREIGGLLADAAPAKGGAGLIAGGGAANSIGLALNVVRDRALHYKIQALIQQGHAVLVAAPTLITQNRMRAVIEAGEEVPYQERTGTDNTSVAFKKAVLRLEVTPIILPHGKVELKVNINQDQLSGLSYSGAPGIQTQKLETQAVVANQHSLVLGGITQTLEGKTVQGMPFIRHIPIVGWLLSMHQRQHNRKQLLVMITPKLL